MTGVAVNETVSPVQMEELGEGEMVTEGTTGLPLTVILVVKEVAVFGLAQGELDVSVQKTVALLLNAGVVYVGEFVPTELPFSVH